eukprot:1029402-Pleurochrysis_carterae.AAC.1
MSKEDISHMNGADVKKLTHKTIQVAMALHERHNFHLAVATDGAKKGKTQDRMESQKVLETAYGVRQGPESAEILRGKGKGDSATTKAGNQIKPTNYEQSNKES